jgi:hypothetical protein
MMRQDPIAFSRGGVMTAFAVVIVLVAIGIGGAWLTVRSQGRSISAVHGATPSNQAGEPGAAPRELGALLQTLIRSDTSAADQRTRDRQRLTEYGWVDQSRGLVRIPIARAMQIVAQEGR